MTSQRAQLQTLITEIETLLGKATPRLPWVMAEESSQQRRILEQARDYLKSLQGDVPGGWGAFQPEIGAIAPLPLDSDDLSANPEAASQRILQALLQEMQYLHTQTLQPLRTEVGTLQQQREQLLQEVRQLEIERLQLSGQATSPQLGAALADEVVNRLRDALIERLTPPSLQSLTQEEDARRLQAAIAQTPDSTASDLPPLHPQQRLEQLKQIQAQTDYMLLKLDSNLRAVFESMEQSIQSYRDSLHQGLDTMHGLGQQGEVIFKAFISHLAQQLSQDSPPYLEAAALPEDRDPRILSPDRQDYPSYGEPDDLDAIRNALADSETEASPVAFDFDDLDLDIDIDEDEEVTLFQLNEEITQLQLDDLDDEAEADIEALEAWEEEDAIPFEPDDEDATIIQMEPIPWSVVTGQGMAPTAGDSGEIAADGTNYEEIDALYESLFGVEDASEGTVPPGDAPVTWDEGVAGDVDQDTVDSDVDAVDGDWEAAALDNALLTSIPSGTILLDSATATEIEPDAVDDLSSVEGLGIGDTTGASEPITEMDLGDRPEAAEIAEDVLDTLLGSGLLDPGFRAGDSDLDLSSAEMTLDVPEGDAEEDRPGFGNLFGEAIAPVIELSESASPTSDTITSLAELLPTPEGSATQRFVESQGAIDSLGDNFIPAPADEDLLETTAEERHPETDFSLSAMALSQLTADLSGLEGLATEFPEIGFDDLALTDVPEEVAAAEIAALPELPLEDLDLLSGDEVAAVSPEDTPSEEWAEEAAAALEFPDLEDATGLTGWDLPRDDLSEIFQETPGIASDPEPEPEGEVAPETLETFDWGLGDGLGEAALGSARAEAEIPADLLPGFPEEVSAEDMRPPGDVLDLEAPVSGDLLAADALRVPEEPDTQAGGFSEDFSDRLDLDGLTEAAIADSAEEEGFGSFSLDNIFDDEVDSAEPVSSPTSSLESGISTAESFDWGLEIEDTPAPEAPLTEPSPPASSPEETAAWSLDILDLSAELPEPAEPMPSVEDLATAFALDGDRATPAPAVDDFDLSLADLNLELEMPTAAVPSEEDRALEFLDPLGLEALRAEEPAPSPPDSTLEELAAGLSEVSPEITAPPEAGESLFSLEELGVNLSLDIDPAEAEATVEPISEISLFDEPSLEPEAIAQQNDASATMDGASFSLEALESIDLFSERSLGTEPEAEPAAEAPPGTNRLNVEAIDLFPDGLPEFLPALEPEIEIDLEDATLSALFPPSVPEVASEPVPSDDLPVPSDDLIEEWLGEPTALPETEAVPPEEREPLAETALPAFLEEMVLPELPEDPAAPTEDDAPMPFLADLDLSALASFAPFSEDTGDGGALSEPTDFLTDEDAAIAPSLGASDLTALGDLLGAETFSLVPPPAPQAAPQEPAPPPEAPRHEPTAEWFLGLDLGTTGISAVLMNRLDGTAYPLYWTDTGLAGAATTEMVFRLPAAAVLGQSSAGSWQLQSVGSAALTVNWHSSDRTSLGRSLLLTQIKPFLTTGIPYADRGRWEPNLQVSDGQQVSLDQVLAAAQALFETLNLRSGSLMSAAGLDQSQMQAALDQLQGVVIGHPSTWFDTYQMNLREAVLAAQLVSHPSQIFFLEEEVATVLSGLPDPSDPATLAAGQSQALYQCNWQGGTIIISGGATVTGLGLVNLPQPLSALSREDFVLRTLAYGGDALDLDIISYLLYPPERRQPRPPGSTSSAGGGWNWQATLPELADAHWADLGLEGLDLPRLAEPDLNARIRMRQRLESSTLGQSLLEAARYLKLILQNQAQCHLELADQSWRVMRRDLESRILVPYVQRINQHLNALLSQAGMSSQGVNQVICTGGNTSFAFIARWLRQKFPNATIIQDTYLSNRPASCSRVAYGLVNLCRYPQLLDGPRHQYSDYFLLWEMLQTVPDQPMPLSGLLHLLETRGVNTEVCQQRIVGILEGHLPPGLVPDAVGRSHLSLATLNTPTYQALTASPLFTRQSGQIYMPNLKACEQMRQHLEALMVNKRQTLDEPLLAQLVLP